MRSLLWVLSVLAVMLGTYFGASYATTQTPAHMVDATVKIEVDNGFGSGVYVGRGYVLTAAHVVAGQKTVLVKSQSGNTTSAEVLWSNAEYDVALLRSDVANVKTAKLSCSDAKVGAKLEAVGNPRNLEFVHMFGRVAGVPRKVADFKSMAIASMLVVPGMSGGPVLNEEGAIVGLVSAVRIEPFGMGGSMVPISYFVPGSVVCSLMAR